MLNYAPHYKGNMHEWMYSFRSLKFGSTQAGGHLHTLPTLSFGKKPRVPPGQAPELVQKLQREKNTSYTAAGK
jgi:hypothetical protein